MKVAIKKFAKIDISKWSAPALIDLILDECKTENLEKVINSGPVYNKYRKLVQGKVTPKTIYKATKDAFIANKKDYYTKLLTEIFDAGVDDTVTITDITKNMYYLKSNTIKLSDLADKWTESYLKSPFNSPSPQPANSKKVSAYRGDVKFDGKYFINPKGDDGSAFEVEELLESVAKAHKPFVAKVSDYRFTINKAWGSWDSLESIADEYSAGNNLDYAKRDIISDLASNSNLIRQILDNNSVYLTDYTKNEYLEFLGV